MYRNTLIKLVGGLYISSALILAGWGAFSYLDSSDTVLAEVKGATTDSQIMNSNSTPSVAPYPVLAANAGSPDILSKEYALYNPESGKMIAQSTDQTEVPIASTTKMMTAHLTSLYGNLNDVTTISATAADINGSVAHLQTGEQITIQNLLYCLLLPSGNDAAHALAEYIGGILLNDSNATPVAKTARFVVAMNAEAARLHMNNTHYLDPAGLDDNGHSTAVDLTKIATADLQDPKIEKVMNTANITVTDQTGTIQHVLQNSDRLVASYQYPGSIGGKTGFTPAAGHCLMSGATRNGMTLIAVVLNTDDTASDASANEAEKLLDWGFANVTYQ